MYYTTTVYYTTLNRIRAQGPCYEGWQKLLAHLGKTKADDEPLPFAVILEANGLDDALWTCRAEPDLPWRKLAVLFGLEVLHLMNDNRSVHAMEVSWLHASGQASDEELAAAWDAASAAAWDAASAAAGDAASDAASAAAGDGAAASAAASDAAWAAAAAGAAAGAATWAAASDAASDATWAAARAAASDAAWAAARAAARQRQSEIFLNFVTENQP